MSATEYKTFLEKDSPSKYHNKKIYVYEDGFVCGSRCNGHGKYEIFDSQKEYERYNQLRLLERTGAISTLSRQIPLVIQEAFTSGDGVKHRPITYRADFMYEERGRVVVEDVKGIDKATGKPVCTEAFKLKWKLLQAKYPNKIFRIF